MSKLLQLRSAMVCAAVFLVCVAASHPSVEMGLNDDWAYIWSAHVLSDTGRVVYNGWETTMLGWQLYLGAFFIKIFGFSFFVVRTSTLLISMATCILLQRLFVRLGSGEWNAVVATLTLVLSPLFLLLGYSFMTDVPGLFVLIVCIYSCVRALQDGVEWKSLVWLIFAELSNALGGSVRQIAWLGVLVVVPCTIWLMRRRKDLGIFGTLGWFLSIEIIFLLNRWFSNQPYTISEPILMKSAAMPHYIQPGIVIFRAILGISLLLVPPLSAFLVRYPEHLRTRRNVLLGSGLVLAALIVIGMRHRSVFESLPFGTHYVTSRGVLFPGMLGQQPVIFNTPVRTAIMMLVASSLLCFLGVLVSKRPQSEVLGARDASSCFTPPDARQLLLLLGPLAVVSVVLLVTRSALFDRYYPPVLMLFLVLILRVYETKIGGRFPKLSTGLVAVFALWGVASTHDFFAMNRARLAAANELRVAGIPRFQIRGGFEYDGVTELEIAGHVNEPRIRKPAGAYLASMPPKYSAQCVSWFADRTPSVRARFVLAHDDSCFTASQYAPVVYRTWLPPREQKVYIREVPAAP